MTTDAIYEERRSDWSRQVSAMVTTQWLQRDRYFVSLHCTPEECPLDPKRC